MKLVIFSCSQESLDSKSAINRSSDRGGSCSLKQRHRFLCQQQMQRCQYFKALPETIWRLPQRRAPLCE